jgi:hypothetical protein
MLLLISGISAPAAEGPPVDAVKYPQDTPKKALQSILRALEKRDFDYWIVWLICPENTKHLIKKHGSIAAVSLMNSDDRHRPRIEQQISAIKEMLKADKVTEGATNGVTWVRYHDEERVLQLEKQPDGRWSMNTHVCADEHAPTK